MVTNQKNHQENGTANLLQLTSNPGPLLLELTLWFQISWGYLIIMPYIMEQLGKRHKIIPIPWAYPVFPLAHFTVALVGTNIEKCDMQFVTATFAPPSL